MSKDVAFIVTVLDVKDEATLSEVHNYVQEAVSSHGGGLHPMDPLFGPQKVRTTLAYAKKAESTKIYSNYVHVDDFYIRGYALRGVIVDYLNSEVSKDELRKQFTEWENSEGTKFLIPPPKEGHKG